MQPEELITKANDSLGDYAQELIDKNFQRRKNCLALVGELISDYDELTNRDIKKKLMKLMHAI